jgi:hypothetical protein
MEETREFTIAFSYPSPSLNHGKKLKKELYLYLCLGSHFFHQLVKDKIKGKRHINHEYVRNREEICLQFVFFGYASRLIKKLENSLETQC